jgi:hypothetical protein
MFTAKNPVPEFSQYAKERMARDFRSINQKLFMDKYEPINLVQQVQKSEGQFDREKLITLLNELNDQDFNQFCKQILSLSEFHDSNVGAFCTDQPEGIKAKTDEYWELK